MSAAAVPPVTAAGRHNVFVYGSLLAEEVVIVLLKRVPPSAAASLPDYNRYSIKGRTYPAILPVKNKKVDGKNLSLSLQNLGHCLNRGGIRLRHLLEAILPHLRNVQHNASEHHCASQIYTISIEWVLFGITDLELDILDTFEDVEYERIEISMMDGNQKLQAYTYVWADKDDPDLEGEWDFDKWRQQHMQQFIGMTIEFGEEYEQQQSDAGRLRLRSD